MNSENMKGRSGGSKVFAGEGGGGDGVALEKEVFYHCLVFLVIPSIFKQF